MIKYQLVCKCKSEFESWFRSSADFDQQLEKGLLSCPVCGSSKVTKALMAPNVATSRKKKQAAGELAKETFLKELGVAARKMREFVEQNADNVGDKFADEARKMHYGEAPKRGIYGQAGVKDIAELEEEGVEVIPLPVLPEDKN